MTAPTSHNRLDGEASPYLRQHADNPVHWLPWGDEAFETAREHDVPVFVSIGYAACHWCHVMAEESFEDEAIAAVLNVSFVSVKVDREERPDVDSTFMTVCQLVTGGGGWPLSAWCTPDGKPFYVGTYFPPQSSGSGFGLLDLCRRIADSWSDPDQRAEMERRADQWVAAARDELESHAVTDEDGPSPDAKTEAVKNGESDPTDPIVDTDLLRRAAATAVRTYDDGHGGFGSSGPKFPMPGRIDLLLREATIGRNAASPAVYGTLDAMANGGIYDQIGGGFHRYAVDRDWTIPHFEKMLYDNAELPMVYLAASRLSGDPSYTRIAAETLAFLERELRHDDGGFFSTLDARSVPPAERIDGDHAVTDDDARPVEGAFYAWTPAEVDAVLESPAAEIAKTRYGIRPGGNFERGTTVPTIATSIPSLVEEFDLSESAVRNHLVEARSELFDARERRPRPARDEKVLAAWNGRAISAFVAAGWSMGDPYPTVAAETLAFCRERLYDADTETLSRRWLDGDRSAEGYLEDYAFLARGAFDVYSITGDPEPLAFARTLAERIVDAFYDEVDGTIYVTTDPDDVGTGADRVGKNYLFARPQERTDRSTPSSLGIAAETLTILDGFRTDRTFRNVVGDVLGTHADRIAATPLEHASLVRAALRYETGGGELTIAAETVPPEWRGVIGERYLPDVVIAPRPPTEDDLLTWLDRLGLDGEPPVWAGRTAVDGEPTVYACEGFTCSPPQTELETALAWLADRR